MTGHVKVSGNWKDVDGIHAKVNGTWQEITEAYTKVNGTWEQWYQSGGAGLTGSLLTLSGELNAWNERTVDITPYVGETGRLVFHYVSGSNWDSDLQLDYININGSYESFESNNGGYETTTSDQSDYESASFSSVPTSTSTLRWNRRSGGTPSSGTGRSDAADGDYYLYAEASSSGYPNKNFWLRSPSQTFTSNQITFSEARYGPNIGTLNVYLYIEGA